MCSRTDPATLFGAAVTGGPASGPRSSGPDAVPPPHVLPNEISAAGASGDLAHTLALEHTTASVNGAPPQP